MKKNVKFFGCILILLLAMSACETDYLVDDGIFDPGSKSFYNKILRHGNFSNAHYTNL